MPPDGSTTGPVAEAGPRGPDREPDVIDQRPDRQIADMAGPSALPRQKGELVFESAWAARVFGMTVGLNQSQRFHWNEFRDRLIAEIGAAEREERGSTYYERWFAAFERVLTDKGLVTRAELEARTAEFARGLRDDVF